MKIPNKPELQQIDFNHSSDIESRDFTKMFTKNVLDNHIIFLVIDTTFKSNNPLHFRNILLEGI